MKKIDVLFNNYCHGGDNTKGEETNLELDPDLVVLKLWRGQRTPQNDHERKVLEEIQEMQRKGQFFEVDFN